MRRYIGTRVRAPRPLLLATGAPILAILVLAACVPDPRPLWPALTGEPGAGPASGPYVPAAAGPWPSPLSLNDGRFRAAGIPAADPRFGERLAELRSELAELARTAGRDRRLQQWRDSAIGRSEAYVAIVTRIDEALASGAVPGDPALQRRWRQAVSALDRLAGGDPTLARLVEQIAADDEALDEIVAALGAESAATRDLLLDDARAAAAVTAAMLDEAVGDLAAQRSYIAAERANLRILRLAIANGERYGISLANRAAPGAARASPPAAPKRGDSPLVAIRFNDDAVRYALPLYRAATLALERRSDALFTLVAVAPQPDLGTARERADEVRRTLVEMGLPESQLAETAWTDTEAGGPAVHLYVR